MGQGNFDLTQTGAQVQTILNESVGDMKEVTWAQLKALRDGGTLTEGRWYRITDFVTTVAATEDEQTGEVMVRSAGHQFDVLVMAESAGVLAETALAARHTGDTYFQSAKLEAWQLKYCLDNDTTRFAWADTANGKGVIYEMTDEWGNTLPYDFKNVQFRRYLIKGQLAVNSDYDESDEDYGALLKWFRAQFTTSQTTDNAKLQKLAKFMHKYCGYYSEQYIYDDGYEDSWDNVTMEDGGTRMFCCLSDDYDSYAIISEVDMTKACWCYTFGVRTALTVTDDTDHSLPGKCAENDMTADMDGGAALLGGTVFVWNSANGYARKNLVTGYFRNNTFSGNCERNTFSGYCSNNTFSGNCYNNSFSGSCYYDSFSGNCYNNSFSGYCGYNSFSGECRYNTFSGKCERNTFSGNCERNRFSGYCGYNSFSGDCGYNSFSGYCGYNSFSGYCNNNTFSGNMQKCTITTPSGTSGTVKCLYTLGSISGETISIPNNNNAVMYAAVDSNGDLQTWNPADNA